MKIRAISPTVMSYKGTSVYGSFRRFMNSVWGKIIDIPRFLYTMTFKPNNRITVSAIKRWQYVDKDILMFEACFQLLVNYVEGECAWLSLITAGKHRWYHRYVSIPNARYWGLRHLNWEIALGKDSPYQSAAAAKIKELYLWYTEERNEREDPWEAFPDSFKSGILQSEGSNGEEKFQYSVALKEAAEKERAQLQEDTDKLMELAEIRIYMWT